SIKRLISHGDATRSKCTFAVVTHFMVSHLLTWYSGRSSSLRHDYHGFQARQVNVRQRDGAMQLGVDPADTWPDDSQVARRGHRGQKKAGRHGRRRSVRLASPRTKWPSPYGAVQGRRGLSAAAFHPTILAIESGLDRGHFRPPRDLVQYHSVTFTNDGGNLLLRERAEVSLSCSSPVPAISHQPPAMSHYSFCLCHQARSVSTT